LNVSERLRVLFIAWQYYPVPAGGAEHQARLQAEELARRGHVVTVLVPRARATRSGVVNGVFVRRLPIVDRHPFRTVTFLAALAVYLLLGMRSFHLAHVHLAGVYTDPIVALGLLLRRPVYIKIAAGGESGEVARLRRVARFTKYFGLRRAARVQALSEEIADELMSVGVPERRIARIPNGVDVDAVRDEAGSRTEARAALGLPESGTLAVYLGRFSQYKGVQDLIEAWEADPPPDSTLVLVGYRADRPPEEQLERPPTRGSVMIRDWANDVRPYLRASDVFVLPSRSEGMSNVLLEAMAAGLPSIATRVGAAEAVVSDGGDGLLVPPAAPPQLGEALRRLCDDPELRARLGAAAARTIDERFSIAAVMNQIEAEYREILASRG